MFDAIAHQITSHHNEGKDSISEVMASLLDSRRTCATATEPQALRAMPSHESSDAKAIPTVVGAIRATVSDASHESHESHHWLRGEQRSE